MPSFPKNKKTEKNRVRECQSTTYIYSFLKNGKIFFKASSDTLITKGLCALLILAYENLPKNVIINNPPTFIKDLNLHNSLSPTRANGLSQIYLKMKEDAINLKTTVKD